MEFECINPTTATCGLAINCLQDMLSKLTNQTKSIFDLCLKVKLIQEYDL